jgi:hypothetical protein
MMATKVNMVSVAAGIFISWAISKSKQITEGSLHRVVGLVFMTSKLTSKEILVWREISWKEISLMDSIKALVMAFEISMTKLKISSARKENL